MKSGKLVLGVWTIAMWAGCALAPCASAQQAAPPADQPAVDAPDATHLRDRLSRMLKQLEASTERIRGAIKTLDDGGTVGEAIEQLGGPMMVRRFSEGWERWNSPNDQPGQGPGRGVDDPRGLGRGQPGGRVDWPGMEGPRAVNPDEILAFLRENAPEYAERLESARAQDPRRFETFTQRLGPRVFEILSAREHDPDLADILTRDFRVGLALVNAGGDLVRARQSGDDDAIEQARAVLRSLASEQVDLRLARRELEVRRLEERLGELRADVDRQREQRGEMIDDVSARASEGPSPDSGPDGDRRRNRRGRDERP